MTTRVARWGNSLAVRVPKGIAEAARLREGETVDVSVTENGIITLQPRRREARLAQLVALIRPDNRHAEAEWGPAAGDEAW